MKSHKAATMAPPVQLTWSYYGIPYRVTAWPEVQFERQHADAWVTANPGENVLAAAVLRLDPASWRTYLEFVPTSERTFLEQFRFGRLAALQIISRCPDLLSALADTPALVSFLAAHASLRGTDRPHWEEIAAVHQHGGIFGLLEWLGLPASRQTLTILRNLVDPDVPKRLLEPLRSMLWEPSTISALQNMPEITDQKLARYCHALAA